MNNQQFALDLSYQQDGISVSSEHFYSQKQIEVNDKQNYKYVLIKLIELGYNYYDVRKVLQECDFSLKTEQILQTTIQKLLAQDYVRNNRINGFQFCNAIKQDVIKCQICYDSCDSNNQQLIQNCNHIFCVNCIQDYLYYNIINGYVIRIACPYELCTTILDDDFIEKSLNNQEVYQKFQKYRSMKLAASNQNLRSCPRPDCEQFVHLDESLVCQCGQQLCGSCYGVLHFGVSCDEQVEMLYLKAVEEFIIQQCPQCKSPIQKEQGCNHMTCLLCRYEFCWICRQKFSDTHYDRTSIIFGCPVKGMQFSDILPYRNPKLRRFGTFLKLILLLPFLLAILLIVVSVTAFILPTQYIIDTPIYGQLRRNQNFITSICFYFLVFLITIVLYPFSVILSSIYFILKLFQ